MLHWEGAEASQVQALLLSAFSGLGDLDGLAGCRCLALDAGSVWRRCAEKTGDWTALLASADLEAAARNARTATVSRPVPAGNSGFWWFMLKRQFHSKRSFTITHWSLLLCSYYCFAFLPLVD